MGRVREKLTFANVMSVTAVFIALGGTAFAATQLAKNSVGAKQIKKGAVRSPEVKNFSLRANDFVKGVLPSTPGGTTGQTGQPGATGAQGPAGEPVTKLYAFVKTGGCCGGAPPPDPPLLFNAHGVTGAEIASTGQYEVTFDASMLPGGSVETCLPVASLGSRDAASPLAGILTFARVSGFPTKMLVVFRNTAGTPTALSSGGGSDGFSIALFC